MDLSGDVCITSVHYAILIDGKPHGHITLSRGIWQGDPISPYLFIICAEVLSGLVTNANKEGLLLWGSYFQKGP